ncbi:MAG: LapA family protein [Nocardioides sp.]
MSDSETRPEGQATETEPTHPAPGPAAPASTSSDPLRASRTSGLWIAVAASGIVLVLLIVFIVQNTDPVNVRFLGWEGETPLAVAMMVATAAGLFLATIAGSLRILQLRRRIKRESR